MGASLEIVHLVLRPGLFREHAAVIANLCFSHLSYSAQGGHEQFKKGVGIIQCKYHEPESRKKTPSIYVPRGMTQFNVKFTALVEQGVNISH